MFLEASFIQTRGALFDPLLLSESSILSSPEIQLVSSALGSRASQSNCTYPTSGRSSFGLAPNMQCGPSTALLRGSGTWISNFIGFSDRRLDVIRDQTSTRCLYDEWGL